MQQGDGGPQAGDVGDCYFDVGMENFRAALIRPGQLELLRKNVTSLRFAIFGPLILTEFRLIRVLISVRNRMLPNRLSGPSNCTFESTDFQPIPVFPLERLKGFC